MERLAVDKNIQVAQILQEEPYCQHIEQGFYAVADVEAAVYSRMYQEEEYVEI